MTTSNPCVQIKAPGDFAQILPFLIGYQPKNCIALHGVLDSGSGTGPTMTLPLPDDPTFWEEVAEAFAVHFLHTIRDRGRDVRGIIVFLCATPLAGDSAEETANALRPLADSFVGVFRHLGRAPVMSTIAIVDNRWWAFECEVPGCCEGQPLPGPDDPDSVTAQLARLGRTPGPRSSDVAGEYRPITTDTARYHRALDEVGADITEQTRTRLGRQLTRETTAKIMVGALQDFRNGSTQLADEIAARLIIGLQDNEARDQALAHSEDDDLPHARHLWGYLARRCVPPHTDLAPPLLTLLAWVAWRQDDTVTARHALQEAMSLDPAYRMANLLHEAINGGADREKLLEVIRTGGYARPTN